MKIKANRFLLLFVFVFSGLHADQSVYWNAGKELGSSVLSDYKSNMSNRVNNPVTNGTDLYTIDNSQKGDASITCSEEKTIMRFSYSVSGGGDIDLSVAEDLDLSGNYEKSFYLSGISGVCANGFIKCDSGTWNSCKYYLWGFNGSNITYSETDVKNLGGCYCINNSCGSISSNSQSRILGDIAGGIANLLKNNYVVSGVKTDATYAYIYGKNINCNGTSVPVGMDEGQIAAQANAAKADTNSTYYVLTDTATNVNNNPVDSSFKDNLISSQKAVAQSANWNESDKSYSATTADGKSIEGGVYIGDINNSKYCEVEWTATDTQAYSDNTNKETATSSATTIKTEIRECLYKNGNFICPVDASKGETIKHDCGSVNDFGEVVGALSAVNEAAKDFTCSTN